VKVDRYNRCLLVDDRPFFPFGPVSLSDPKDIPWMARVGFNTYFRRGGSYAYDQLMQQGVGGEETVRRDETLNLCQEHGMMVVDGLRSYTGKTGYRKFRELRSRGRGKPSPAFERWFGMLEDLVPHAKRHPALLGYCPFDEPKRPYQNRVRLGDTDPHRPVLLGPLRTSSSPTSHTRSFPKR
jgi:hypothetical protein